MTRRPLSAMARRLVVAGACVALAAAALTACTHPAKTTVGRLTVAGQAEITRPGQDRREVTTAADVRAGDRIHVREGTAEIRLSGNGDRLELRMGADVELDASAGPARVKPALTAGDLLVTSGSSAFVVGAPEADVTVTGVARVSSGVSLLVATYQGSAGLAAGGSSLVVPALRQAAVRVAGPFPTRVTPLEYSAGDPWDQRFLSDAIDLGNQLAARSSGFSAQLGTTDGHTVAFFDGLFPSLAAQPGFDASLLDLSRPPGDTLVGLAIALQGTQGSFPTRTQAVFAFRDAGAPWGLVALDQGVSRAPLLDAVQAATSRSPANFANQPPGGGVITLPTTTTTPTTVPAGSSTSTTTRRPTGSTTTTVPATTTTTAPLNPLNTKIPLVDDTVNSLVQTLNNLLRSLGQ